MNHNALKIRLYITETLCAGAVVTLAGMQAHYTVTVMRLKAGAEMLLFNGRDGEWRAVIETLAKKEVTLRVAKQTRPQTPEPDLWLGFAPIKRGRIDFLAQKATELGASKLIPVKTERTIISRVKVSRLLANAREAAEQCGRLSVPGVVEMQTLEHFLARWPEDRKMLFCDEEKGDPLILEALGREDQKPAQGPWGSLIGPEGGFASNERELIRSYSYCIPASLGPRVLRADTAAFAAISLWQAAVGDW